MCLIELVDFNDLLIADKDSKISDKKRRRRRSKNKKTKPITEIKKIKSDSSSKKKVIKKNVDKKSK